MVLEMNFSGLRIFHLEPHSSDVLHGHGDCYQMSIPLAGTPSIQCNQEIRRLSTKNRLVVSPDDEHRHYTDEKPAKIMVLGIKQTYMAQILEEQWGVSANRFQLDKWGEGCNRDFYQLAQRAFLETMQMTSIPFMLEELEYQLVKQLLLVQEGTHRNHRDRVEQRQAGSALYHPALKRAMEYLQEEFTSELFLDQVARISGVTKFHLIQLFRKQLGTTPSQYLTELRLKKARWLVQFTAQDITSIAFEAGFGSLSAFQRSFKKRYGMSCREMRQQR
ncbi:helix-turn-helix domain-containing protein [Brevibacillus ginsengisoli]|uniref:helix-turn-helix domain-containing protein n=1 Tax=Brevibacillus ginsengisoli TaxID=363854 RepID=UPI003CF700F4